MLKKSILLIASCALSFLLAELAVRIAFPQWAPGTPRLARFWQYDENLGWSHVPGVSGVFSSFGFDVDVSINSSGFRGPEFTATPDPARRRIVVLGDSFVWGYGVEQDEIFTTRIAETCDLEVINLGVSGYSTGQELMLLRQEGLALESDAVVLVVSENDFGENTRAVEYIYYGKPVFVLENGQLVLGNHPVPRASIFVRGAAAVARRSYILTQVGRVAQGLMIRRAAPSDPARAATPAAKRPTRFPRGPADELISALIMEFADEVARAGADLVVAYQTPRGAWLADHLGFEAPPVLIDRLVGGENHSRTHIPRDIHWNADGHAVVADAIVGALIERGVVSGEDCGRDDV